ncbi:spore coat protein CotH, partial [Streptomyces sp. NPDC057638]
AQAGPGGRGGMPHPLKSRFLALDAFDAPYKKAYRDLYRTFYASGSAEKNLKVIAERARSAGADSTGLDAAVTALTKTITARSAALAKDKEVTG